MASPAPTGLNRHSWAPAPPDSVGAILRAMGRSRAGEKQESDKPAFVVGR